MSLIMKGHRIPKRRGSLHVLGELPVRLMMEGVIVWEIPKVTQLFTATTSIIVPEHVHSINLCGSASGGGGSATQGGSSGQIFSNVAFPVVPGEQIFIVIGEGGAADTDGEDCSFGTLTLSGGTAGNYPGIGTERVTCGGRHYDGSGVGNDGGQASTHGNGGDAGLPGTKGSGGGSNAAGGKGIFQVTYFFEDL